MRSGEQRGHRRIEHTADVIVEAWAPDLAGCLEEAVAGLVGVYVETDGPAVPGSKAVGQPPLSSQGSGPPAPSVRLRPGPAEAMLLTLLDEVVFVLDTGDGVPVGAEARPAEGGGVEVSLRLVPADQLVGTGSVPKAIARSELAVTEAPGRVSCRFLVDV